MSCKKGVLITLAGTVLLMGHGAGAETGLFVVTSDFQTGSVAYLPPGEQQAEVNLLTIHSDAVARYYDGKVYVLNRLGQDNVLVLDPADPANPLLQFSVGNGSNPQDIEFAGPDKAYVSRHESSRILIVDPRNGDELGEIDLSDFADGDGLPEVAEMVIVGSRLYAGVQRLDRNAGWTPAGASLLVVVDTGSDTLVDVDPDAEGVQGIELATLNPNSIVALGDKIFVSGSAAFGDRLGGIEIVDTASHRGGGLAISEEELGGEVTGMAMVSTARGYAIVADDNFVNWIKPFDLSDGTVGDPLSGHSGGYTPELATDGSRLIVADQGTFSSPEAAGLLIYDAATGEKLSGPISVGLPPASIAVLGEVEIPTAVLAATRAPLPQQVRLGRAFPNPFNAQVQIPFAVAGGQREIVLAVYDALGRRIRTLVAGRLVAGNHQVVWDGYGDTGDPVGSGIYLIELRAGARRTTAKVLLLK